MTTRTPDDLFQLPPVGRLGARRVSRAYMLDVEARAKRLRSACRIRPVRTGRGGGARQMGLWEEG